MNSWKLEVSFRSLFELILIIQIILESTRSPIIGETVQIRTADGRLQDAVVKYVRGDSEYKVRNSLLFLFN